MKDFWDSILVLTVFAGYYSVVKTFFYSRIQSKTVIDTLHAYLVYSIPMLILLTFHCWGVS